MTLLWHWKWRTHSHTGGRKSLKESPWLQTSRADGQLCSMRKRCLSYVYWGFIISSSFFSPLMVIKQLMGHCSFLCWFWKGKWHVHYCISRSIRSSIAYQLYLLSQHSLLLLTGTLPAWWSYFRARVECKEEKWAISSWTFPRFVLKSWLCLLSLCYKSINKKMEYCLKFIFLPSGRHNWNKTCMCPQVLVRLPERRPR